MHLAAGYSLSAHLMELSGHVGAEQVQQLGLVFRKLSCVGRDFVNRQHEGALVAPGAVVPFTDRVVLTTAVHPRQEVFKLEVQTFVWNHVDVRECRVVRLAAAPGCVPHQALWVLQLQPPGLVVGILERNQTKDFRYE